MADCSSDLAVGLEVGMFGPGSFVLALVCSLTFESARHDL